MSLTGATSLVDIGLSDDQHPEGSDYQSYHWVEGFFENLSQHLSRPLTRNYRLLPPSVQFTITPSNGEVENKTYMNDNALQGELVSNKRLTHESHFQDVRLVEIGFGEAEVSYKPGDVLWVYPRNCPENVNLATELLNLTLTDTVTITSPFCMEMSVRELLTSYLDIVAVPERQFFELCSNFPTDELEKEKFQEFTNMKDTEELYSYVSRPKRNILEVLSDFHSVRKNLDISYLFDVFGRIKPRGFSIASAQSTCPKSAQLYRTNLKSERVGLCSTWLSTLPVGAPVMVSLESGSFNFPPDRPIIMVLFSGWARNGYSPIPISRPVTSRNKPYCNNPWCDPCYSQVGPGTGIAPFRSLIQSRAGTNQKLVLFFGCRYKDKDYLFESEWVGKPNLQVFTAFSRDQKDKVYVQDRIREHGELVWRLISREGAVFCVAGNSKNMPLQVKEALTDVVRGYGQLSPADTTKYIDQLIKGQLYQNETW
eukprot:sb/3464254/